MVQFLGEAYFLIVISALLSVVATYFLMPYLRNFAGLPLSIQFTGPDSFLIPLFGLILLLGLVCGIYPSFVAVRFNASDILNRRLTGKGRKSGFSWKILILVQFCLSILLIIGSMVIFQQMEFMKNKDLGFNKDQLMLIHLNYSMNEKLDVFEDQLRNHASILEVSHSSSVPGYRVMREPVRDVQTGKSKIMRLLLASHEFIETYDLELEKGSGFNKNKNLDISEWILNQAAVDLLFEPDVDPIDRTLSWGDTAIVVGVVKDFHFESLHTLISPMAIKLVPRARRFLSLRFDAAKTDQVISSVNQISQEIYPNLPPVEYEFLDSRFEQLYQAENKLQSLVFIFCAISMALTFSGIFAMAAYITQRRTKEIAVRKVLGGSFANIIGLIGKNFLILITVSLVITIPISWFATNWWLSDFAYHTQPGMGLYILAAAAIILIVMGSAAYNTIKAAMSNPVNSLRSE